MARLSRDVPGARLIALREVVGYRVVRRRGSHLRLERPGFESHAITVHDHAAPRIGTLAAILHEVGAATHTSGDTLIDMLEG